MITITKYIPYAKFAIDRVGEGHYYKIRTLKTYQNHKEHQKICRPSLHRKCLCSLSILRQKSDFQCSDFTYGVKKDHNIENQNINYLWHITYGYQGHYVKLG
jgi:hypothetical protein